MNLRLDWCSYEAAKYACENWHYSGSMPSCKKVKIGVWENNRFIGAIIFAVGATPQIGSPFNLTQHEICELSRVALREHETPVSKLISISLKMLKKQSPGIRLVVSYADSNQGHIGKVYQAGNWIYIGEFSRERGIKIHGRIVHKRSVSSRYGTSKIKWLKDNIDPEAELIYGLPKYKYLMPLDNLTRGEQIKLSKPYPKCARSIDADASAIHAGEGGSSPTLALQNKDLIDATA